MLGQQILKTLTFFKASWFLRLLYFFPFFKHLIWKGAKGGSQPVITTTICLNVMVVGLGGCLWGFLLCSGPSTEMLPLGMATHPRVTALGVVTGGRNVAWPAGPSTLRVSPHAYPHPSADLDRAFSSSGSPHCSQPASSQIQKQTCWTLSKTKFHPITDDWNQNYSEPGDLSSCEVSNLGCCFWKIKMEGVFFFLIYHLYRLAVIITLLTVVTNTYMYAPRTMILNMTILTELNYRVGCTPNTLYLMDSALA